jgi:hypothetical protein
MAKKTLTPLELELERLATRAATISRVTTSFVAVEFNVIMLGSSTENVLIMSSTIEFRNCVCSPFGLVTTWFWRFTLTRLHRLWRGRVPFQRSNANHLLVNASLCKNTIVGFNGLDNLETVARSGGRVFCDV